MPNLKGNALTIIIIVAVLAIATSLYFYSELRELKTNPGKAGQEEVQKLMSEVSKLILLPVDETPTVATVTDPAALKDQQFFAHAEIGDKVLLFTNARKAILYRPETHKIIEVAPISLGNTQAAE